MKRLLVRVSFALAVAGSPAFAQEAQVVDGVAGIVNGEVITISQVQELVRGREEAIRQAYPGPDVVDKIRELRLSALKDLIDRQLILQEFKKKEFNIPPYVIDDRVQDVIRKEFGGDRAAFVRTLQAQGFTLTRFKEIEKDKIIVQAMRQANVKEDFIISPVQIQQYYDKNKANFSTPEQVKLRMIVLREEDASSDIAAGPGGKKAMAEEIRDKLVTGASFDRMATMYSEDSTTKDMGGDWGWIDRKELNEELSKVAFSLPVGKVSPVVQLGGSYYLLYVEDRKAATIKPISEVREEVERNLIQQERIRAQQRWLDTLRSKAYIKIFS